MSVPFNLLTEFVARYPAQPATAFLRSIEIDHLAKAIDANGLGLDLGCGDGILTDILFKRVGKTPRLVGVDIDPLETEAAASYPFYERIHTCPGDAIPEADGTFDYVVSNSVLEHIPDLESVIAEASRVLNRGGRFYFTVPGPGFHENLRGSVVGVGRERYLADLDRRLAHFHYLSALDWAAMCDRNGLRLESVEGYINPSETRRWENLSRMTGGLLHTLSFGKSRPIEIQRALKLRSFQNSMRLPKGLATVLAKTITLGLGQDSASGTPSCLLVTGSKPNAD